MMSYSYQLSRIVLDALRNVGGEKGSTEVMRLRQHVVAPSPR